jgi:hypothetical protein
MMFADHATSKQIANYAGQVKRAASMIRAVLDGTEAFMQTFGDIKKYKADFSEAEMQTLRDAAMLLEKLRDRRATDARAKAAEEKAYEARKEHGFKQAAAIFDSWQLDTAAWLVFIFDDGWSHLQSCAFR